MSSLFLILTAILAFVLSAFELRYLVLQCDHNTPRPMLIGSALQAVGGALFIVNPPLCAIMLFTGRALFLFFNRLKA